MSRRGHHRLHRDLEREHDDRDYQFERQHRREDRRDHYYRGW